MEAAVALDNGSTGNPVGGGEALAASAELNGLLSRIAEDACRQSFAALFEHFAPRIKGFMMRGGTPEEMAEEIVQETMVTVWTKAGQFDPAKAGAATWIFTIARNKRIDMIRRQRRPEPDPMDPMFEPEPEPDGERVLSMRQDEDRVRAAILDLPADQAEVVRLSFYESLPHSVIADRLGLPLGTVKSRLRLAFRKVRGALGEE